MQVRQPSWNLEKVTVKEPEGQTFTFVCNEGLEREQVVLFPSFDPLHVTYTVCCCPQVCLPFHAAACRSVLQRESIRDHALPYLLAALRQRCSSCTQHSCI